MSKPAQPLNHQVHPHQNGNDIFNGFNYFFFIHARSYDPGEIFGQCDKIDVERNLRLWGFVFVISATLICYQAALGGSFTAFEEFQGFCNFF